MCDYFSPTSPHLLFKSLHSIPFAESPQPLSGRQSQSRNDDMLFKYPKETPHLLNEQMNLPPPFQRGLNEEEHTRPFMNCNEILYCSICGWHSGGYGREDHPILSSLHLQNCVGLLGASMCKRGTGSFSFHFASISRLLLQFPAAVESSAIAIGERSGLGELTEPAGKLLNDEERKNERASD